MSANLDRIKARIRALREMTEARGCAEQEALQAASRAFELMRKYRLSDADLETDRSPQSTAGKRRQVIDSLWPTVAYVCRCQGWLDHTDDGLRFVYFGAPADVLVAEYLHDVLLQAFKVETARFRNTHEYQKRRKRSTRNAAVKAFQTGLRVRLESRLKDLWWLRLKCEVDTDAALEAHGNQLATLDKALAKSGTRLTTMRPLKPASNRYGDAVFDGWCAGGVVALDPGVAGSSQKRLGHG